MTDRLAEVPTHIADDLQRRLDESLAQQAATADVLKIISRSSFDLQTVLETLINSAVRLCGANRGSIFLREGEVFPLRAASGTTPGFLQFWAANPSKAGRGSATARVIASGKIEVIADVLADPEMEMPADSLKNIRAALGVPMLRDYRVEGVMVLTRPDPGPFSQSQIDLVQTFADQAVIAIENARLFDEVQAKTRDLTEALNYQTGSSNILKVIASSPADVEPVLKAIVDSACELCSAYDALVRLRDGDQLALSAHHGPIPVAAGSLPISRNWTGGLAALERKPVHIHDLLSSEGDPFPEAQQRAREYGHRSILTVPMLREGESVGVIIIRRNEVHPFTDKQIALLQTFADQAVIAIENTRLFNETNEALERQTATADILKVIASSPSDVQPVFEAIAASATRLLGGFSSTVILFIADALHLVAFTRTNAAADEALQASFPRPLAEFPPFELVRGGATVEFPDTEADNVPPVNRELARLRGYRSMVFVPLMSNGQAVGILSVTRVKPGTFPTHDAELLRTFADQAVIAIENARLLNELRQRTEDLGRSLENLRAAQDRLVQTEKLASLGQLTAGIAHEIKNPLNFVNNFSALSAELTDELNEVLGPVAMEGAVRGEVEELTRLLKDNLEKVVQHGKRADSIVKNMLLHSRQGSGEHRPVDINAIVDESLNLAYHGARAENTAFNITMHRDFDSAAGMAVGYPQEITRALLNLISNGFYAATKRKSDLGEGFEPTLAATTRNLGDRVEIRIRDNGAGIASDVLEKIFNPFFTTKPAGEGTGLGLSMSHDIIVKQHGGTIDVDTAPGAFTEFRIVLPRAAAVSTA